MIEMQLSGQSEDNSTFWHSGKIEHFVLWAFGPGPGPGGQLNFDIFKISHVYYKLTDKLMPNTFAVTTIGGT